MHDLTAWTKKNNLFLLIFIWTLLWFFSWGKLLSFESNPYLTFLFGLMRLGVAMSLFVFPGALLYIFLNSKSDPFYYLGTIPVGFAFSVMLIGLIGLIGRVVGFSFGAVKFLFFLIGLVQLVFLFKKNIQMDIVELTRFFCGAMSNKILVFTIFLSFILTFSDMLFFIDDTTYLAYLTNWQYSGHLGFQNIIHEPVVLELERFWLAMYPMGQAILSDLSGIPGVLLLSNYLELLLVPLAVVTAYWFARVLGFSRNAAAISALMQISLYGWMIGKELPIGTWFYNSIAEDKVSAVFHLAPVFFVYVIKYIQTASWKNLILAIFAGVALALTHPVSLFFSCVIAAWLAFLGFVLRRTKLNQVVVVIILIAFLMSPYIAIRLFNFSSNAGFVAGTTVTGGAGFQLELYTNVVSDVFYGLNPGVLMFVDLGAGWFFQFFRLIPVFIGAISLILSFLNLKEGLRYQYIFSAMLLVFLVTFPYTGWIFGYFTDARLISRASWFSPLGMASVIILQHFSAMLKPSKIFSKRNSLALLFCSLFTLPVFVFMNLPRVPKFFKILERNMQLAEIGSYVDAQVNNQVVSIGLDYMDMILLPGVSAKTKLISFREEKLDNGHNYYLTDAEIKNRIYASDVIRSLVDNEIVTQERCKYIKDFDVKFVVANNEDVDLYIKLIDKCGVGAEKIYQTRDKSLVIIK